MKRYLQVFVIISLLLTALLPVAAVAQAADTFGLAASAASVKTGEDVVITVKGESLTDVYGAELEITYDAAKLQYTGYSSSLRGQAFIREPEVSGGRILLVYTYTGLKSGLSGNWDLFALTFKAADEGKAPVKLKSVTALNHLGQSLTGTLGEEIQVTVFSAKPITTPTPSPISTSTPIPTSGPTSTPSPASSPSPASTTAPSSVTSSEPGSGSNPGKVTLEAVTSSQGIASANVRREDLLAAAGMAKEGALTLQIHMTSDATELRIHLPVQDWKQLASVADGPVTIKFQTDWASITIHVDLLNGQLISDSSSLQLIITKADSTALPLKIRERVGNAPVYDFSLLLDGIQPAVFNGNIKVELSYVPQPGESSTQVIINHITDNGILEVVKNGRYNALTGQAEFKPNHFSKYTINYASVSFRDMAGYSWANEAVLGLAAREVIQGRSVGHFVPGGQVTRAEFVQMLVNLFEMENTPAGSVFTDVKPNAWYSQSIAAAHQAGVIQGKADGSFGVSDPISREDMAVLIYRTSKLLGLTATGGNSGEPAAFLDLAKISPYAREAVNAVQQGSLMNGLTQGYFGPENSSTRAQAAAVLFRLYQARE
ncbi:hypothetical protein GC101_08905 [Paenibacillus sp. LMG 31459]|uniref:SLH domain-containing protein n=1 Tax=Paenibacillus phytohabitans TaxID=2654978 RepID=A0ABX1YDD8_9BACL|nr:S-layer homology domain-containing protein [Paenibacillus phytohabitans]NOU79000.1 hypothetical protein [Paenibacillus phytohabitans]